MTKLKESLKNAFAVDPPGPAEPTPTQQPAVDWVCMQIARRHLTTPGLIFLEMSRPLNAIAAAAMHFAQPGAWALLGKQSYESYLEFGAFLERRGSIEYLCRRIEHFEETLSKDQPARPSQTDSPQRD